MAFGPGKYDEACTAARQLTGGGVVLIVLDGKRGSGFSAQITLPMSAALPDLLRQVAADIEGKS